MKFQYASGSRPLDGFTIKRGIGRGGFGEVYFALSDAGKEVALKRVQRNLEIELRGVSQCLNLKHPNLVSLFDIRRDPQDETWVVMEYVAGDNLRQTLDQNPQGLPQEQVVHWMRGILAGVAYLHDQGIVHRDLKPGNIFEDYGAIKIGDYGLSKSLSASRRSGQTESIGTAHYMAPEIGKGTYGKSIDLYACGVMLFEMLTGHLPFDGESSHEILMKHLTQEPDLTAVPIAFRPLLKNALHKDPQQRIGTAKEFLQQLADADAGRVSAEAPVTAAVVQPVPVAKFYVPPATAPANFSRPANSSSFGMWMGALLLSVPLIGLLLLVGLFTLRAGVVPLSSGGASPILIYRPIMALSGCMAVAFTIAMGIRLLSGSKTNNLPRGDAELPRNLPDNGDDQPGDWHGHWDGSSTVGSFQLPASVHGQTWNDYLRGMLARRSYSERSEEWVGSLLLSAMVVGILHVLVWMARSEVLLNSHQQPIPVLAWSFCVATLGAWMVLTLGKFQEGATLDPIRRRGEQLLVGFVLGLVAIALARFLTIEFPLDSAPKPTTHLVAQEFFNPSTLGRILVTIAALFATIGWWKQSDPVRENRISFGKLVLVVVATWVWSMWLSTAEPMLFLAMASMSLAIQFASPWIPTQRRLQLRRAMQERRGHHR